MIRRLALASLLLASPAFAAVDFAKQIMPLLDKHCVDCHSASDADGDFALDTLEGLLAGGKTGKAFAPGKAQDSLLVKFLEGRSGKTGKNQFMPPGKRDHLSAAEIALVRQWIDEGAPAGAVPPTDPLAKLPKIASQTKVKPIHAIAVSAKLIALGRFGSVELIDTATRQSVRTLNGITGKASALVFSADGASVFIAAGDAGVNGIAYHFNTADGKLLHQLTGHTDALYALALSPDGHQLATGGYDQKIKLWDVATGKEVRTIKGHNGGINALAYRPDGKVVASASSDRTVKLWDTATGNRLETFSQPLKEQLTLAFSADGRTLLAGGGDSRIRQWRISDKATEGSNPILETKFAHEGSILQLVMSPDGKSFASSASDRALKVWNSANVTPLKQFDPQSDWASAVAWIDSTHLVAARQDGTAAVYDVASGKTQPLLAAVKSAAAPPNKKSAAKPELTRLFPRGFQSGVETLITATGKGLTGVKQIKTTDPRVVATKLEAKGTTLTLKVTSPTDLPRGSYEVSIVTAAGETAKLPLLADDLPQFTQPTTVDLAQRSADVWGTLMATGQRDEHRFKAQAGQTFVLDLAAKRVGSKAETIQLELLDANGKQLVINHGLDSGSDPFIAFQPKADGEFIARVSETTLEGSADHAYRLTITNHSYVTGWWPLTVPVNRDTKIRLVGHELHGASMTVHPTQPGKVVVPGISPSTRFREVPTVLATEMNEQLEQEPNDEPAQAKPLTPPVSVNGRLLVAGQAEASDTDVYAFDAKAGDEWMIETMAAQSMAPTDTRLEVLNADGSPVERMRVQAIRSSWNNFRSVDADNQDIRLENYMETGLNEFVYFNGDIMKTFRLPRGPDGGFFFYTSNGKRRAYFDTTATAHPLDEPCYVVEPLKPNESPLPNGLPVISIPFANDDDGLRKLGRDSRLHFTAPATAKYLIRVTDSRGWSGERFAYRLIVRKPVPDFTVKLSGENMSVGAGSAMGFSLRAERLDDFEEPITVKIEGLPQGWIASSPIVIERGHTLASGSLYAEPTATAGDWSKVKIIATSGTHTHEVNGFGKVTLAAKPKFIANLEPAMNDQPVARSHSQPQVITLVPGQLANAFIRVERSGNDGILNFDVHGLPHGVIVDDIGLNGIQVRERENDREIRFACAKWVQPQERLIHAAVSSARNEADSANLATSFPVLLRVVAAK